MFTFSNKPQAGAVGGLADASGRPLTSATAAASAGGGDAVIDVDVEGFMTEVIEGSNLRPVIVDFWAPWCGPCKSLGPQLEKAVKETRGAVRMVKVNVDENQELAAQMRVQSIPAVYAFLGGRPVDGFVGAVPESQIKTFVQRLLQMAEQFGLGGAEAEESPLVEVKNQAKAALLAGEPGTAASLYGAVLQRDQTDVEALAGLGRAFLAMGQPAKAAGLLAKIPAEHAKHPDVLALKTAVDILGQTEGLDGAALSARLAADPTDSAARHDLALALFAAGRREEAVDQLLELIRRDRAWNDEAGRKLLLRFFEAFGGADPLTVQSRKKLSTILFS